jgi:hypothetical protein
VVLLANPDTGVIVQRANVSQLKPILSDTVHWLCDGVFMFFFVTPFPDSASLPAGNHSLKPEPRRGGCEWMNRRCEEEIRRGIGGTQRVPADIPLCFLPRPVPALSITLCGTWCRCGLSLV